MEGNEIFYVKDLCKTYGTKQVLHNITYTVRKGEVLGVLGSNGAGKSTMFKIISGLIKKTNGEVGFTKDSIRFGSKAYKCSLGIVPQDISLYENMTVKENLRLFSRLYGIRGKKINETVDKLIDELCLTEKANVEVHKLSGGMKRRVNIGAAIVHNPDLIIMDEPTVGIDPENRKAVWDIIENLRGKGKSIIITSHYIEEIEKLSDNVIIIENGKKVAEGSPEQLINNYGRFVVYSVEFFDLDKKSEEFMVKNIQKKIPNKSIDVKERKINITIEKESEECIECLIQMARKCGLEIRNINVKKANLEDVFILFLNKGGEQ